MRRRPKPLSLQCYDLNWKRWGFHEEIEPTLATTTPTLDGEVLAVLANSDMVSTITQIQRNLTTALTEGVLKVLNRLTGH